MVVFMLSKVQVCRLNFDSDQENLNINLAFFEIFAATLANVYSRKNFIGRHIFQNENFWWRRNLDSDTAP